MVEATSSNLIAQARAILEDCGHQEELLADMASRDEAKQEVLAKQIIRLNQVTPGGMKNYLERSRVLLEASKLNVNPFDAYKPSEPVGQFLRPGEPEFDDLEKAGLQELSKVTFVLIAGGLGERLGYSGIKISLPVVIIEEDYSYMKYYCQYILACEARARELDPSLPESFYVPFGIMVSDDTHDRTVALLEQNGYFGLKKEHVEIMKQENVPAMIDNTAKLALNEDGSISTKPHGHGDIHNLLYDSGVAAKWKDLGKEWMIFIQDTNALALKAVPSSLGMSRKYDFEMNSICVQRKPGEAMGAIVKLTKEDGSGDNLTINVEYNQLDSLLRAKWNPEGDICRSAEEPFSFFPGNTNTLIFKLPQYVANLTKTGGVIPEFVNPKYANAERTTFKSPTRLECMMQDYPKLLEHGGRVGFSMYETWFCFSPCKNNLADAVALWAKNMPTYCAAHAEHDFYEWHNKMLRLIGGNLEEKPNMLPWTTLRFPQVPKIFFEPGFALTLQDLRERFTGTLTISAETTIVLGAKCASRPFGNLTIDGTLIAHEPVNFFDHFKADKITW